MPAGVRRPFVSPSATGLVLAMITSLALTLLTNVLHLRRAVVAG
ncbi:MAG: hypothetical protein QM628_01140 [Propionicimonas sp.]